MSVFSFGLAFLVIMAVGLAWFFLYYYANPVLDNPDGLAKIHGNCGDTMEIGLNFKEGRVAATHHWTNGCSTSKNCVTAATAIAMGKTVEELRAVSMMTIMERTGELPDTHLHCAQLAETTLQKSVDDFLAKKDPG